MPEPAAPSSRLTALAIGLEAYLISVVGHEGLGHGGACLLVGGRPRILESILFDCDEAGVSSAGVRWIAAGGCLANLLLAALAFAVLRARPPRSWHGRYFLWMLGTLGLVSAFGYLMFSGIGDFGDWVEVFAGAPPAVWRVGATAGGALLYFVVTPRLVRPDLEALLGRTHRVERIKELCLYPYLAGGTAYVVASVFNPISLSLVLLSAAASSFGGSSLLAWYPWQLLRRPAPASATEEGAALSKGPLWVAAALVSLVVFVAVLGPGVRFSL